VWRIAVAGFSGPLFFLALVSLGCGRNGHVRISDADLPGTYVASFNTGTEKLILYSDNTYEQIFSSPAKSFTNRGKWETKYVLLGGTDIGLIHANCGEEHPVVISECYRNLNVHREGGKLKLALNESADWYYEQVN